MFHVWVDERRSKKEERENKRSGEELQMKVFGCCPYEFTRLVATEGTSPNEVLCVDVGVEWHTVACHFFRTWGRSFFLYFLYFVLQYLLSRLKDLFLCFWEKISAFLNGVDYGPCHSPYFDHNLFHLLGQPQTSR